LLLQSLGDNLYKARSVVSLARGANDHVGNTDLPDIIGTAAAPGLERAPTGIGGLDQITGGGLPRGRVTLVAGSAGAGKTLLGLQFPVAGAREHGEAGVLLTFGALRHDRCGTASGAMPAGRTNAG
jgi:predicted ATP-dependent serine protease